MAASFYPTNGHDGNVVGLRAAAGELIKVLGQLVQYSLRTRPGRSAHGSQQPFFTEHLATIIFRLGQTVRITEKHIPVFESERAALK